MARMAGAVQFTGSIFEKATKRLITTNNATSRLMPFQAMKYMTPPPPPAQNFPNANSKSVGYLGH